MDSVILEAKEMCKNFGSTVALNHYSISIRKGEILGLIGENGSGKSTISSILAGIQKEDGGEMIFHGKSWTPESVLEAQQEGIGMIVQEAGTIPSLTVAQNLFLGIEKKFKTGFWINNKAMNEEAKKALDFLGLSYIYPSMPVRLLDMQDRKLLELVKILYLNPEILILDEMSTALSYTGRQIMYKQMKRLVKIGKSVLVISHDLEEIMTYCDRLSILRDGEGIIEFEKSEYDEEKIKTAMIGREIEGDYYRSDMEKYSDEVVLSAERITNLNTFMNLSFKLHKGEILGIGGLSDCGMHEIGKALFGAEEILIGEVVLPDKNIIVKNSKQAVEAKMAYVSKDRDHESLALDAPIYNNIASAGYFKNMKGLLMSTVKERKYVKNQMKVLSIKSRDEYQEVKKLSGGNKQKVVFGKWLATDADICILDCPTRGVDIGVKASMYQLINDLKKQGKSIVMISEEMPELIGMSDRILIIKDGAINGEFFRTEGFSENQLINAMV